MYAPLYVITLIFVMAVGILSVTGSPSAQLLDIAAEVAKPRQRAEDHAALRTVLLDTVRFVIASPLVK